MVRKALTETIIHSQHIHTGAVKLHLHRTAAASTNDCQLALTQGNAGRVSRPKTQSRGMERDSVVTQLALPPELHDLFHYIHNSRL